MRIQLDFADVEHVNVKTNNLDVIDVDWPAVPRVGEEVNVGGELAGRWLVSRVIWEIGDYAPQIVLGPISGRA